MWLLVAVAGCASFVGSLLPWVSVARTGTVDIPRLIGEGNEQRELALLVIGGAVALMVIGVVGRARSTTSVAGVALAIGVVGAALTGVWGIVFLSGATRPAHLGVGPFVTIGGFLVATVCGVRLCSSSVTAPGSADGQVP